jgi:peroxiredoxin family protein
MRQSENPLRGRGLGLVVFSGDFSRVHYALAMASAALAIGRPAVLFFTMGATRALVARGGSAPGWHELGSDSDGISAAAQDRAFAAKRIATFEELLSACRDLGARFIVCETGLNALGLEREMLRPELSATVAGLVSFYQAAAEGDLLFI